MSMLYADSEETERKRKRRETNTSGGVRRFITITEARTNKSKRISPRINRIRERKERGKVTSIDTQTIKRPHNEHQVKPNGAEEEEDSRRHERKRGGRGPDLGNEPTMVKTTVVAFLSK
jgi:hypothetical protein